MEQLNLELSSDKHGSDGRQNGSVKYSDNYVREAQSKRANKRALFLLKESKETAKELVSLIS